MKDPFDLPPGPERRKLMAELGFNVSPSDFTDEEIAAQRAAIEARRAAASDRR